MLRFLLPLLSLGLLACSSVSTAAASPLLATASSPLLATAAAAVASRSGDEAVVDDAPKIFLTLPLVLAAKDIDEHHKNLDASPGQIFAKKYFAAKTLPLGELNVSTAETGWSAVWLELQNVASRLPQFWQAYYTVSKQWYSYSNYLSYFPLPAKLLAFLLAEPEVAAAKVASAKVGLDRLTLGAINKTVGEILNVVGSRIAFLGRGTSRFVSGWVVGPCCTGSSRSLHQRPRTLF